MARFRKKPVVIEAYQIFSDALPGMGDPAPAVWPAWLAEAFAKDIDDPDGGIHIHLHDRIREMKIRTLEGDLTVSNGDFVIQGVKGELYPCKPDIFEATYEAVDDGQ